MIKDALGGKIDLIVTKSVSRFARNTVDSLTAVRKLKDANIEIYFEKENMWSHQGFLKCTKNQDLHQNGCSLTICRRESGVWAYNWHFKGENHGPARPATIAFGNKNRSKSPCLQAFGA
jgi:hypothetical protein